MPEEAVEHAVRESFARQSFLALIGAKLIYVGDGEIEVELPHNDRIGQQSGIVHAGVIAAIADVACGYAALTRMPSGYDVVSVEFKLNLLAPARGGLLVARGRVIRSGRTLSVSTADVFADGVHVATMTATMFAIPPRMAKNDHNQGGPTHNPKDEPTADRNNRNAKSRDELKQRSVHGARPGIGKRNGSSKNR